MRKYFQAYLQSLIALKTMPGASLSSSSSDEEDKEGEDKDGKGERFTSNIKDPEEKKEFFDTEEELAKKLDTVAEWIKESQHTIVFTGAGISTRSV